MSTRLYVETDSPVYVEGDSAVIRVKASNTSNRIIGVDYRLSMIVYENGIGREIGEEKGNVRLAPGELKTIEYHTKTLSPGRLVVILEASWDNIKLVDSVESIVVKPVEHKNYVAIVWHNHQAPNYLPDNTYHADWAFRWVWYDLFKPFTTGGPYYVHYKLLLKHDKVKVVQHLSPSLLKQWIDAVEHGYRMITGEYYPSDSREVSMVKEVLEGFKTIASTSRVEFLSSVYAHTILGYILSKMGMEDIVRDELELGLSITEEVLGVRVRGVWTPEMAWDQRLAKIYDDYGVEYTILCGKNHFPASTGKVKKDIYMPYLVEGSNVKVFFRNQRLSDIIGFENYFPDEKAAERTARRILVEAVRILYGRRESGVLVLALDGENWMIFSKTPAGTYLFLDKFYEYLELLESKNILFTTTLSNIISGKEVGLGVLNYIPTTSWLGGFHKWDGEIEEHRHYWVKVNRGYRLIKAYESMITGRDNYSLRARWALYHAIDSDYWWAEFWNKKVIDTWLNEVDRILGQGFRKIRVDVEENIVEGIVGEDMCMNIVVVNDLGRPVKANILVSKPFVETQWASIEAPQGTSKYRVCTKPRLWGEYRIPVLLVVDGYIVSYTMVNARINPRVDNIFS